MNTLLTIDLIVILDGILFVAVGLVTLFNDLLIAVNRKSDLCNNPSFVQI